MTPSVFWFLPYKTSRSLRNIVWHQAKNISGENEGRLVIQAPFQSAFTSLPQTKWLNNFMFLGVLLAVAILIKKKPIYATEADLVHFHFNLNTTKLFLCLNPQHMMRYFGYWKTFSASTWLYFLNSKSVKKGPLINLFWVQYSFSTVYCALRIKALSPFRYQSHT